MPQEDEHFEFKFTTDSWWRTEQIEGFLRGNSQNSPQHSVFQYILLNLSNVTVKYENLRKVLYILQRYYRDQNVQGHIIHPVEGVKFKLCHAISQGYNAFNLEAYYVSPATEFRENVISTIVSPNIADKRFSLGGLTESVWISLAVCVLVLSLVCGLFKVNFRRSSFGNRFKCLEYFWFYVSSLLLNTADHFPSRLSSKFLLYGWLLGTMVLMKAYTGVLKSELIVSKTIRINEVEDLDKSLGTKLALYYDGSIYEHAKRNRHFSKEMDKIVEKATFFKIYHQNLFASFRNGTIKYAILSTPPGVSRAVLYQVDGIRRHLETSGKRIYFGKRNYLNEFSVFPFYKYLPRRILNEIDYLALRSFEIALTHRLQLEYDFEARHYLATDEGINDVTATTVFELSVAFHIWAYGIIIASSFLVIEMLVNQFRSRF